MCLFVRSVQPCVPLWPSKEFCCWMGKGELRCSYPVWQGEMQDLFHGVLPVSGTDLVLKAALILKFFYCPGHRLCERLLCASGN